MSIDIVVNRKTNNKLQVYKTGGNGVVFIISKLLASVLGKLMFSCFFFNLLKILHYGKSIEMM